LNKFSVCYVSEEDQIQTNMKNILSVLALTFLLTGTSNAQLKLTASNEKSKLSWLGEKVTGQHSGSISLKEGWLNWQENQIVSGEFLIDMASLKDDEGSERLERHLKSDDFFGVEKYPVARFEITGSTSFERGSGIVKGNLTIKGVTNPIEFKATLQNTDEGTWFYANIVVDRSKFNLRYGSGSFFDNLGDKTIYDEFKLKVNLLVQK
jgi:polyisoprenoid-binding protein YceI